MAEAKEIKLTGAELEAARTAGKKKGGDLGDALRAAFAKKNDGKPVTKLRKQADGSWVGYV